MTDGVQKYLNIFNYFLKWKLYLLLLFSWVERLNKILSCFGADVKSIEYTRLVCEYPVRIDHEYCTVHNQFIACSALTIVVLCDICALTLNNFDLSLEQFRLRCMSCTSNLPLSLESLRQRLSEEFKESIVIIVITICFLTFARSSRWEHPIIRHKT